jgi:hypothetical protein
MANYPSSHPPFQFLNPRQVPIDQLASPTITVHSTTVTRKHHELEVASMLDEIHDVRYAMRTELLPQLIGRLGLGGECSRGCAVDVIM